MKKNGQILLCGLPNAGKSTLINKFAKFNYSLVNNKPQTTRKEHKFFYENENFKIIFVDTPGFHFSKNLLDKFMNKEILKNFKNSNVVCFLFDVTKKLNDESIYFLKLLNQRAKNKLVIIFTKTDLVKENLSLLIDKLRNEIKEYVDFVEYFETNIFQDNFPETLINQLSSFFTNDEDLFFENDENDNFLISEIIRGNILKKFRQEIPYGIFIKVEEKRFDPKTNIFYIEAYIFCENESHKKIIIGNKGNKIKEIGVDSRKELLEIFDTKIYLDLKVKVSENWRNNEKIIKKVI